MTQKTYEDGDTVTYQYDNDGALATITDSQTGITTTHYYDFVDRLASYQETGTGFSHQVGYSYDLQNNLTSLKETINGTDYTTAYAYDEDNRITSVTGGNAVKTYTYDTLGRTGEQETKTGETTVKTDEFEFVPNGSKTTMQVAQHTITAPGQTQTYSYTYDDNGNILSVSDGTNTTSYVYDSANQLIRENNQAGGFTHTWTYGSIGNITGRKEYAYTTGELGTPTDTIIYAWSDDGWGDLIPAYDGTPITYDEIGNFLTDGTWTYTWQHGRELSAMTNGTVTWEYLYNQDGLRTQKTNGTKTYRYVYNGSSLSQMTVGEDTLTFFYDAAGQPMSVLYNGTTYFYITNLQGDVIGLLDASGQQVVAYTYDAWGNSLSVTGSMASTLGQINPLRYRGYVYDNETQLYYLQSRYYNPEIGRFISADGFISTGQGILGNNMYAYCGNNPVMHKDPAGTRYEISAGGGGRRDVTEEIFSSLHEECRQIRKLRAVTKTISPTPPVTNMSVSCLAATAIAGIDFYHKVDHGAPWDIKLSKQWENTIGTTYPVGGHNVAFDGKTVNPEMLGNLTYGYLGYKYGIPLTVLYIGSYYAAGFPTGGDALHNEVCVDWKWITKGYEYAFEGY